MASQQQPNLNHNLLAAKHQHARASTSSASSMTSYSSIPVGPPSSADLMAMNRLHSTSAPYPDAAYTTSGPAVASHFAPASSAPYDALGYAPASRTSSTFGVSPEADPARRISQQHTMRVQADERRSFADALDASHGMLAMSQETPRNIYGSRSDRSSVDSYGFPSTHSTSSSMSSNGNFSSYYGDSVSDYSTAGSDIESVNSRTLPRPPGIMTQMPPAPQSMMSQFNSKIPSTTQKKHKCKPYGRKA
ncbi:hypothetical protein CDD82_2974 [Ophiocordyceps australis]|uniref:Uncharacterized protein n=1 Tax=Ophiocordyceps australis TaxID=1399860 RepID=A0A2C5XMR3_9HYPO|nr:hypothetical protein CDD82_2974 [Ophiocordyceps australis]